MKWWKDRFPVSITRLRNGAFLFLLLSTRRHKITSESGTRGDGGLCLIGPRAIRPSVCHLTHHYDLSTAASPLSRLSLAAGGQPQNERERGSVVGGQDEHHSRNSHFAAVFKRVVSNCFREAAQRLAEHKQVELSSFSVSIHLLLWHKQKNHKVKKKLLHKGSQ